MADVDNLDALSNAELRAQMVAQGLPNIPVTDSSRKVLVKRLRASLGGNSPAPAASPKKTSSRRETLQPVAAAAAAAVSVDKRDGANASSTSKARRTIATTIANDTKEADRRRQPVSKPETVSSLPRVPEATVAKPVASVAVSAPKAAAPIQSRRTSNTERREVITERVIKKPETIAEKTTGAVPKQRSSENALEVNSLIILESDEEEDEQLALAAQNAEDQAKHTAASKLTTTTTSTHQYVSRPVYRAPEPVQEPPKRQTLMYESPSFSQAPTISQARTKLGGYDYSSASRSGRYSSFVTSPPSAYTSTSSSIGAAYRRSPPRTYANEFSDDTAEDEEPAPSQGAKFESDFARKLASLRAERIGDRSSPYNRRSITRTGSSYEPVARRSLRPDDVPVSIAFNRWIQSLDRAYNLKSKLFLLFVLILIYFVYKYFY
ncbi:hypothetical protein ACLKA6_012951 [Drosophila palustris]